MIDKTEKNNLRQKQIKQLESLLNLNAENSEENSEEFLWKVLILDKKSTQIISSVLRNNDLLNHGITFHSLINSKRSEMRNVAAIYFVNPSDENLNQIIEDLGKEKYDYYYINFTSSISRILLEKFAKQVSFLGNSKRIKQVYDTYLDFVVTESNLFSLEMANCFTILNNPKSDEQTINEIIDKITNGLLSVIITLNIKPIIRAPKGGSAEFVARILNNKIREYLSNLDNEFGRSVQQKMLLVIMDRNIDLVSMFSHSWIYQCIVSDVFKMERNTIELKKYEKNNPVPIKKTYDINPNDFFWNEYSYFPFPDVVANADLELNLYKKEAQDLTYKTGINALNEIDSNLNADTMHIQQAVDALPRLTAKKKTLDMHMDILSTLINELQARGLDKFFDIEQNINSSRVQNDFIDLLNTDTESDSSVDKLRTFLIMILLLDLSVTYIDKVKNILLNKFPSIDLNSINYIMKFKEITNMPNVFSFSDASNQNKNNFNKINSSDLLSVLSSKIYGLTDGKISEGLSSITSKIKKFILEKKKLPIANIIEALMDPENASKNSIQLVDDYIYFDSNSKNDISIIPKKQSYNFSLAFIIGGANYLEYQNIQEWANQSNKISKKVIYGGTKIISPNDFLNECNTLGAL